LAATPAAIGCKCAKTKAVFPGRGGKRINDNPPHVQGCAVPLKVIEVGEKAGRWEGGGAPLSQADLVALRLSLEQASDTLLDADRAGPGVRLRK